MEAAKIVWRGITSGFLTDLKSRNWSVYGQWLGVASFILSIVFGVINLLHLGLIIIFSIIALVQGLLILFLEVPFLLRICPITERFAAFMKFFHQNLPRAGFYAICAAIQWGGIGVQATSLIACAAVYTVTAFSYLMAYISKQEFMTSATLGGDGVVREMLP
ncbi:Golgi apparatus membrane protein TVP18 [Wickerhamiella sorbophila]|uniref:Golgi apparatus membrane protein TVP18 n=1 Tax=Wickerhamiella sorbophila TaxID=45607 RepID=A0A2T0FPT5_9ASCO|nr:Golgi apparatus membrane protein TVP18 [Wickerhamiella sorbophila]PRT57004.1 Golgi apparatus membrane protein TVP18 [Wickerhamiella sorbophila]